MREVAVAAGLSLGAAYHYFPTKQAIVHAYYEDHQSAHDAIVRERLDAAPDLPLRERLGVLFHTKLDLLKRDRRLLAAIARSVGDPDDPLSAFSPETRTLREQSLGTIERALEGPDVAPEARELACTALWALVMGVLLYYVHDRSRGQERTRRLVDRALDLLPPVIAIAGSPLAAPIRSQLIALLDEAELR